MALITLVILFATSVLPSTPTRRLALAAAVFDILALATLMAFLLVQQSRPRKLDTSTHPSRWLILLAIAVPFFVALVLTITVLAWISTDIVQLARHRPNENMRGLLGAAFAVWAIWAVSQAAFLTLSFSPRSSIIAIQDLDVATRDSGEESSRKRADSVALSILAPPPHVHSAISPILHSPTLSTHSSQRSSVRNSVQQFLRPMSSRSRLIRQPSFQSDKGSYNERPTSVLTRQEDSFDTWEVESEEDEPVRPRPNLRLETIPGSRPVSPAKPLNGPFPDEISPEELPLPESPTPHGHGDLQSPASPAFYTPTLMPEGRFPFPISRRPSANNQQSHIHPLFRTDSPVPPPLSSPGTILTASPWGGQVITDPEQAMNFTRPSSRQNSRPSSPNIAAQQSQRPRTASMKGARHPLREDSPMQDDGPQSQKVSTATSTAALAPPVFLQRRDSET